MEEISASDLLVSREVFSILRWQGFKRIRDTKKKLVCYDPKTGFGGRNVFYAFNGTYKDQNYSIEVCLNDVGPVYINRNGNSDVTYWIDGVKDRRGFRFNNTYSMMQAILTVENDIRNRIDGITK